MARSGRVVSVLFLLFGHSWSAQAQTTVLESFASTANKDSSQMVWNTARGELHPPIFVDDPADGGGLPDVSIDVGAGGDGSFSSLADYARVGSVTGTVISINSGTYEFTDVTILAGYVLRPTGAQPLVLKVLGDVNVYGAIDCSGDAGATTGAGGSARCGGGAGGLGATIGFSGSSGGTPTSFGIGGGPDGGGGPSGGGGGGGPFRTPSGNASGTAGAGPSGGAVGIHTADSSFTNYPDAGGGGGGGGSSQSGGAPVGSGGGAGGGVIKIYSAGTVTVDAAGVIRANGGSGGSRAGLAAGAGGGGGGGSIQIFAGVDVQNNGAIEALPGTGGASGAAAAGGNGFYGRTWVSCPFGDGAGNVPTPDRELSSPGSVRYGTSTYIVTSKAIDLHSSRPKILTLPISENNAANGTLTYEVAFGDTATDPALTSFDVPANFLNAEQKRYFAFRITVDNNDDQTPNTVTDLSVNYVSFVQGEFEFKGTCGSVQAPPPGGRGIMAWLLLAPLLILTALRRKLFGGF